MSGRRPTGVTRCRPEQYVFLHCRHILTVAEIADRLQRSRYHVYRILQDAGVSRCQGTRAAEACAAWIDRAVRLQRAGTPIKEIARTLGQPESTMHKALARYPSTRLTWARKARAMHARGIPWPKIAARLGQDVEDIRVFVTRIVGYERGKERMLRNG